MDCFHYMEQFATKREKKKSLAKQITAKFTRSNLDEESEPRPTNLKKLKKQSSKFAQETAGQVTPWLPEHIKLLDDVVPVVNFKRYAEVRKAAAACSGSSKGCAESSTIRALPKALVAG